MIRRDWKPPTLRETVAAMQENITQAARMEANAAAAVQRLQPGDERLNNAIDDKTRFFHDQKHWRAQLAYWRGLLVRFPELAERPAAEAAKADFARPGRPGKVVPMGAGERAAAPHWSEPREREPGSDDFDELPF